MREHHDALVKELAGKTEFTDTKKARLSAYVCYWLGSLASVVERYQHLVSNGTIPVSNKLSRLLTDDFVDLLKPFRNAVTQCSEHDDWKVLSLVDDPKSIPDRAEQIAGAFREYIKENSL